MIFFKYSQIRNLKRMKWNTIISNRLKFIECQKIKVLLTNLNREPKWVFYKNIRKVLKVKLQNNLIWKQEFESVPRIHFLFLFIYLIYTGNSYYTQSTTPLLTFTVEDDRVIPSTDLSYIRYIYQKTGEKIPTWNAQVYKIDSRMNYVIATKANVDVTKVIEEFFQFYDAFDRKLLSLESIATLRNILDGFPCFRDPYIYCMDTPSLSVVDLSVSCSLVNPLTCKMDVSRHLS